MKKTLTKSEKIFTLIALLIANVLCIVKFFIGFIKQSNLINWLERTDDFAGSGNLSFLKVILIVSVIVAILLIITSLLILLIKNRNLRGNIIISIITFLMMVVCFYFIGKFVSGEFFSIKTFTDNTSENAYMLEYAYLQQALYLIASLLITLATALISHSIACEIYSDNNKMETGDSNVSIEEESIIEEIKSLKAKLRIKDLENEYLNLKAKLDE